VTPAPGALGTAHATPINAALRPIREKHKLPALAGAIVTEQGMVAIGAVGAPTNALWHIGSNTKAMTASLLAKLVEQGKLKWETTIGDVFPAAPEQTRNITLLQLLSHRSGLPANGIWLDLKMPVRELRRQAVMEARLQSKPGEKYEYSNLGYVIAGAMAERVMDASWEELIRKQVFEPLGMTSVGFGGVGGKPDNPPVLGPAGRVHCTLADWSKYIAHVLCNEKELVPPFGGNYALGWIVCERKWGGGKVLTHNGSNTLNYSVAWVAPKRKFAVLVCTNQGGAEAAKACDEAASALIRVAETSGLGSDRSSE
jgi:CubicO group peptidase (beta-lactamase class C family)